MVLSSIFKFLFGAIHIFQDFLEYYNFNDKILCHFNVIVMETIYVNVNLNFNVSRSVYKSRKAWV